MQIAREQQNKQVLPRKLRNFVNKAKENEQERKLNARNLR